MLSRVADNLYWFGRYSERAENTARLINVNAHLMLDLPRGISPGWRPLIDIYDANDLFTRRHEAYEERSVLRFLIGDGDNPGSILCSIRNAREIARTVRDMLPREAWELANELHLHARDNLNEGLTKRGRYAYLRRIIIDVQTLNGLLEGAMNSGPGYHFLCAGRYLERADMTSRIVDVRSASLLPVGTESLRPYENIQWMSVLKSLTAYQMYRQAMRVRVNRAAVLEFLLRSEEFPRAFYCCVRRVAERLEAIGGADGALRALGRLQRTLQKAVLTELGPAELHELLDRLQLELFGVHDEIAASFFQPVQVPDTTP